MGRYVNGISQNTQRSSCGVFLFMRSMANRSTHQISRCQRVSRHKSINIKQSVLSNESVKFHLGIFYFPINQHKSAFPTHVGRVCHLKQFNNLAIVLTFKLDLIPLPASKICKKTNVQQVRF